MLAWRKYTVRRGVAAASLQTTKAGGEKLVTATEDLQHQHGQHADDHAQQHREDDPLLRVSCSWWRDGAAG